VDLNIVEMTKKKWRAEGCNRGLFLELEFVQVLSWYISCCWSLVDGSVGKKEGLIWHLEVEVLCGYGSWISHLI